MEELVSDLTVRALKLPTSGSSYKAQNPWAVFYFCALLSTGNIRDSLHCRIKVMASKNVTVRPKFFAGVPLLMYIERPSSSKWSTTSLGMAGRKCSLNRRGRVDGGYVQFCSTRITKYQPWLEG
jgi:hypothetical protein